MRNLGLVLFVAFAALHPLLLIGCDGKPSRREVRAEADLVDPATVLAVERLDFPAHDGSAADALQFEVEYSDGTKAGCVHIWSGVACVPLKGEL